MNSLTIAINYARRIIREYQSIVLMFVFPLLIGVLTINIHSYNVVEKVGISNKYNDSHPVLKLIKSSGKFEVKYLEQNEIKNKLFLKEIDMGVIIPDDFEMKLLRKEKAPVKIICLTQNSNVIYLRLIFEEFIRTSLNKSSPQHLIVVKNNYGAQRTSMGFFLLFILLFSGTCTELLIEDKKNKTYIRYFCAPVKEYELYLGTFINNLILGAVQILFFLLITKYVFNFDWKIPVIYVFSILVTFLITSIGISIGLVSLIKDNKVYSLANALISIFTCFISGSYFSSSLMGENLDRIANFFPQKWAIQSYERLVNGYSFADIQQNLLILLLFAAVFFTFGVNALRPSESDL